MGREGAVLLAYPAECAVIRAAMGDFYQYPSSELSIVGYDLGSRWNEGGVGLRGAFLGDVFAPACCPFGVVAEKDGCWVYAFFENGFEFFKGFYCLLVGCFDGDERAGSGGESRGRNGLRETVYEIGALRVFFAEIWEGGHALQERCDGWFCRAAGY